MTSVTIHDPAPAAPLPPAAPETPTQAIVKAASAVSGPHACEDAQGRRIVWKKLGALDNMRLAEIVGPGNIANAQYMLYANTAFSVQEIGGERLTKPMSKLQLEALVQRLGDEGIDALWTSAREHGPKFDDEGEGADMDAKKNSLDIPS